MHRYFLRTTTVNIRDFVSNCHSSHWQANPISLLRVTITFHTLESDILTLTFWMWIFEVLGGSHMLVDLGGAARRYERGGLRAEHHCRCSRDRPAPAEAAESSPSSLHLPNQTIQAIHAGSLEEFFVALFRRLFSGNCVSEAKPNHPDHPCRLFRRVLGGTF